MNEVSADRDTDKLYRNLRSRHGGSNAGANGYRLRSYFLREQELVLAETTGSRVVVDLGCGSGLMIQPVSSSFPDKHVYGLDFNETACVDAKNNKIKVVRGDVYSLPFADDSIDCVINCQFLNQQPPDKARYFVSEVYRILDTNGRLVMIWRNDKAFIHKLAVSAYHYIDKLTGRPEFPYFDNDIHELAAYAAQLGFQVVKSKLVFPLFRWQFDNPQSIAARLFGASCFLVLEKT